QKRDDFFNRPNVIANARFHRWGHAERLMDPVADATRKQTGATNFTATSSTGTTRRIPASRWKCSLISAIILLTATTPESLEKISSATIFRTWTDSYSNERGPLAVQCEFCLHQKASLLSPCRLSIRQVCLSVISQLPVDLWKSLQCGRQAHSHREGASLASARPEHA